MTKVVKVNPLAPGDMEIEEASQIIKKGGLVVFPTETVYGIGADAMNPGAVRRIFEAKGRPQDNPLIVHIANIGQLSEVAADLPEGMSRLAEKVWPGPVTFLLKKSVRVPPEVTAGSDTVAVRMPAHPVALKLISASSTPIAAPSANLSTRPSPTSAAHALHDMDGRVELVLDGGSTFFGVESTIVNLTSAVPVILRKGAFTPEELREVLPGSVIAAGAAGAPSVPGTRYLHYAPRTRLLVASDGAELSSSSTRLSECMHVCVLCSSESADELDRRADRIVMGSRGDLYSIAKNLFGSLRELDSRGADIGIIESFEEKGIGYAIMDRIRRAAGYATADTKTISSLFNGAYPCS
jgi:L-threonylcarbamoyladenylate synthase